MKQSFLFPYFISLILLNGPASAAELWLRVGQSLRLPSAPEATVRIGSRGIIRAIDGEGGLRLIGLKPGTSSLAVGSTSYLVRVTYAAQKDFGVNLKQTLARMMGLSLQSDQRELVVTGTLLRFHDWLDLARLAREHQGEYSFRAHPLPDVADAAFLYFQTVARRQGLPVLRFSFENGFRVHIPKSALNLKAATEQIFRPFGVAVEVSGADLDIAPLVRTRVILAEVSKSFSQEIGVQWPGEYTAQVLPVLRADANLMASLKALEARGQAQILASPTLLCRSGGQARFHAGGEFPIRMISRQTRDVVWKSHGVILNVKPKADFQGAMSLEIETEISLLDMANAVDGIPALKKNRVESHFDLPGKRTVALSGLLRQELGESKEGLPFLTAIPVLGPLFSSQKFLNHQTELVIFVTPEIYVPDADEPLKMPEGWVKNGR